MTSKSIAIEQLVPELTRIVGSLAKEYQEKCDEEIKATAKAINKDIRKTTAFNKSKGKYHLKTSFAVTKSDSNLGNVKNYFVTAKKNKKWRLVHLIENGHRMVNHDGSVNQKRPFVQGRPFLQPLVDSYSPIMYSKIKEIIRNAKGE